MEFVHNVPLRYGLTSPTRTPRLRGPVWTWRAGRHGCGRARNRSRSPRWPAARDPGRAFRSRARSAPGAVSDAPPPPELVAAEAEGQRALRHVELDLISLAHERQ